MTRPEWRYLRHGAMAMSADLMANPLRRSRLSHEELLMRESIQNSADEKLEDTGGPVRFEVRVIDLFGDEKRRLVDRLQLSRISERAKLFPEAHGWFDEAQGALAQLNKPDVPFQVLSVSDYNTNGLGGQWNRGQDIRNRFHNLVLSIGATEKLTAGTNLLGSYGIGKMVYALASNLRTMAYYSVFRPDDLSDGASARFLATGFFPLHSTPDSKVWTGHAFFGERSDDRFYPTRPLTDDDAHDFMESIGFAVRAPAETGLTVLLLDCPLDIEKCRAACEKYWWPRLTDPLGPDFIDLRFFDGDRELEPPRPDLRAPIKPFVDCYRNLVDDLDLDGYHVEKRLPKRGLLGGGLCLRPASAKRIGRLANTVALVRRGLVISYEKNYAKEDSPDAVGVFEAAADNVKAFTLSEPEAHEEWNENHDRLRLDGGPDLVSLVRKTHQAIKMAFRDFQVRLDKRKQDEPSGDLGFLDEVLGPIFRRRRKRPPGPKPKVRAISIHKTPRDEHRGGHVRRILDVSLGLTDEADTDEAEVIVRIDLRPLIDTEAVARGQVPRIILSAGGAVLAEKQDNSVRVALEKASRARLVAQADCHPDWRVRWDIRAEKARD